MRQEAGGKSLSPILGPLLLRIGSIALFIALLTALKTSNARSFFSEDPFLILQFLSAVGKKRLVVDSYLRSFSIIVLCIVILLPILKTLTAEIATDTIWFHFFICQLIHCIESVRVSILSLPFSRKEHRRNRVIPLEESLLITQDIRPSSAVSSIAAVVGFLFVFSRLEDSPNVIYIQAIGFFLYFYLPQMLESYGVHRSTLALSLYGALVLALCMAGSVLVGLLFLATAMFIVLSFIAEIRLIL